MSKVMQFAACSALGQSAIFFTIANFDPLVCSTLPKLGWAGDSLRVRTLCLECATNRRAGCCVVGRSPPSAALGGSNAVSQLLSCDIGTLHCVCVPLDTMPLDTMPLDTIPTRSCARVQGPQKRAAHSSLKCRHTRL